MSPTLRAGGNRTGGDRPPGTDVDTCDSLIPVPHADLSPALKARDSNGPSSDGDGDGDGDGAILVPMVAHSLRAEGFDASEDGTGRGTPLVPVAFAQNQRDEVRTMDVAGALAAEPGAKQQTYIAFSSKDHGADASDIAPTLRSMNSRASNQNGGGQVAVAFHNRQDPDVSGSITHPIGAKDNGLGVLLQQGDPYAGTQEADSSSLLSTLRDRIGTKAVAEWGSRVLDSLQSPEVLRAWLHGEGLRRAARDFRSFVDDCPLPREEGEAARTMRVVWENGPDGRTPQGRGLAKQLAHELGKALPQLPHQGTSSSGMMVRRLTPREAERLQGFPDDYTLITVRGKPAADRPRYKALGNSMAVPVMRWIGERVQVVEDVYAELQEAA